ncbi:CENPX protein, partial [Oxylabes madagascariensis]|nr:CENPX protein [Oxylabes madagascariensis]
SSLPLPAQDTVDRLLRLHFRDGRTRVNADAQLLMAELLKVFVRGERAGPAPPQPRSDGLPSAPACTAGSRGAGPPPSLPPSQDETPQMTTPSPLSLPFPFFTWAAEAAARAARQAQAEDLEKVDIEQLEKVLPQLVCGP